MFQSLKLLVGQLYTYITHKAWSYNHAFVNYKNDKYTLTWFHHKDLMFHVLHTGKYIQFTRRKIGKLYIHTAELKYDPDYDRAYRIESLDKSIQIEGMFTDVEAATTINIIGDSQLRSDRSIRVANRLAEDNAGLCISLGDLMHDGDITASWVSEFLAPYNKIVNKKPMVLTRGNHDGDKTHQRMFGQGYHTFNTQHVQFIILDTELKYDAFKVQLAWLSEALSSDNGGRMRVVCMHKPIWDIADEEAYQHEELSGLFIQYQVPLVLSGHAHLYEKRAVGDTTYITCGCGGAMFDKLDKDSNYKQLAELGYIRLTTTKNCLIGKFITNRGVVDTFTIPRRSNERF